ncbi:MAG: protein kinase [Reyranella sp.]|uniref:serine/threonine-protein kinase n=1 Tax=Reyranella sp. TaxID=1929291 RepID=UPI003D0A1766
MTGPDSQSDDPSSQTIVAGQQAPDDVDYVALKAGQTIGRYQIVSVLGQGGFGITYRARDVQLGREVAIKEYLPSALAIRQDNITVLPRTTKMAEDFSWGRERFVTEGRTLASLHRVPAIVQVFDFLEANGTAYIVMELLHGETLEDRIKRNGKLGPEEVDRILWPLLDGLEQVHSAGFLHRDIKPANILLDAGGNPTLIDFGASRAAMAGRSTALTAIFTPGYAAAEQMTSAKQGPWTDIYGLSATLYHAIAGRVPPSAFDRMLDDACEPLAQIKPAGFKPGVLAGVDAGLSVAARERPQSIAGWRPILAMTAAPAGDSTVVMGKDSEPTPEAKPAPKPPAKSEGRHVPILAGAQGDSSAAPRRTGLWIAIAAVVLILLGGGGYFAFVPRGPDPAALEANRLAEEAAARQKQAEEEAARLRAENEQRLKTEQEAAEQARQKAEQEAAERTQKAEQDRIKAEEEEAERRQKAEQDRIKGEQEAAEQRRLKAEQDAAEQQRRAAAEEEQRKRFEAEARQKIVAEMAAQKRAEEEARRKAEEEAEARRKAIEDARKAIEFVAGAFDHFGKTLMMIGLKDRSDEVRLQGVDIVADPDLHQLAVKALAAKPRHLRCRQTDRLTDGTPLYRCLITKLTAKEPLADVPDAERDDLALALVRNGLVLASCDAPRSYADVEDEARGGKRSLWGRVSVSDYKKRCSK